MNTNEMDRIAERIQKCLRLANGRNATEGEMQAAMSKAAEIARRHGLDLAEISQRNLEQGKPSGMQMVNSPVGFRSRNKQRYHPPIAQVLRSVFGIRVIETWRGFHFLGEMGMLRFAGPCFRGWRRCFIQPTIKG